MAHRLKDVTQQIIITTEFYRLSFQQENLVIEKTGASALVFKNKPKAVLQKGMEGQHEFASHAMQLWASPTQAYNARHH